MSEYKNDKYNLNLILSVCIPVIIIILIIITIMTLKNLESNLILLR